jgi:hypothetical protein
MITFEVHGPFDVEYEISKRGRGGRAKKIISSECASRFWAQLPEKHSHLAGHKGCYVFTLRAGRGSMAWYVGKTEKKKRTLKQEVFAEEKRRKYKPILSKSKRRSPELYFLIRAPGQGRLGSVIDDLETLLIWTAVHRNPKLINKRKRKTQPAKLVRIVNNICIKGLLNCTPGHPSKAAEKLDKAIHFRER